jgi:hypothetical protein
METMPAYVDEQAWSRDCRNLLPRSHELPGRAGGGGSEQQRYESEEQAHERPLTVARLLSQRPDHSECFV